MAAALMLRRLALLAVGPRVVVAAPAQLHSSRSGMRRGPWKKAPEDEEFDGEEDDEGPDMQEVARALKRQKRAILLKKMKREMEPHVPLTRTLTWEAMEQIRQLKEEFPEEWTVSRLAEGFNVDSDVIKRILHSCFSPPLAVKLKQDAKAKRSLGIQVISQGYKPEQKQLMASQENLALRIQPEKELQQKRISGRATAEENLHPNALQLQSGTSPAAMQVQKNFTVENSSSRRGRLLRNVHLPHQGKSGSIPVVPALPTANVSESHTDEESSRSQEGHYDEEWDRLVLSEEEMENLAESGYKSDMKVIQKGREFFDSNGNFLYRI